MRAITTLFSKKPTCTEPTIGRLLPDLFSGKLDKPGREQDNDRLGEHVRECRACFEACVQFQHETVTIPSIRRIAQDSGRTFEQVYAEIADQAGEQIRAGRVKAR